MSNLFFDIRNILLKEWDPVNIGDNPNISDEYDNYIHRFIEFNCSPLLSIDLLKEILLDIECNEIGLEVNELSRVEAAKKLFLILRG